MRASRENGHDPAALTGHRRDHRPVDPHAQPSPGEYRYPFSPYPNGWFHLAWSHEVRPQQVRSVRALGRDLIIFRGQDGIARVMNAHCPHLGANMGIGGRVVGNTIQCPFHNWRFDGEGNCVEIPYSTKVKLGAKSRKQRAWETSEINGGIFVHHDSEGRPPQYRIPDFGEISDWKWRPPFFLDFRIKTHIQEILENVVDLAHFRPVHRFEIPTIQLLEFEGSTMQIRMQSPKRILGLHRNAIVHWRYFGPAVTIAVVEDPVQAIYLSVATPVDELYSLHRFMIRIRKTRNPLKDLFIKRLVLRYTLKEYKPDIPIWENKIYRERPPFTPEEAPLAKIRQWYRQFNPEGDLGCASMAISPAQEG